MIDPADKKRIQVNGLSIAYQDIGSGDPIVFLHGNPTSSFLWRNIIPYALPYGRCIAPDLIGMGDSEKLPQSDANSYTFAQNRHYLDGFFDALDLRDRVTLVVHDWGSALGFDWARRHPHAIKGIIHMEALIAPIEWDEMPAVAQPRFRSVRSEQGEELVLQQNIFIEQSVVKGTLRAFADAEMAEYRRPFLEPGEGRRPMLTWPRQLPIGGEPADVVEVFKSYGEWLAESDVPKLYVRAEPGTHSDKIIAQARSWPNQQEITVAGIHYPQEDAPDEIGQAMAQWLAKLGQEKATSRMILVNLPVRDLAASTAFYVALGGAVNPQFSGANSTSLMFTDGIGVMLLTHDQYREFTQRPIGDARRDSQAMFALTVNDRDAVDATLARAVAAGGRADPNPAQDLGFMYNRHVEDPDGYIWEMVWMNPPANA